MSCAADLENGLKQEQALAAWEADDSQISGLGQPGAGPAAQRSALQTGRSLQDGRQVGIKLGLCFGLLIAILLGTAYLALDRMQRAYASLQAELDESMLELQLAQDGMRYSSENSRIIMELFLVRRPEVIDQLLAHRAENSRKITALIPLLEVHCASDKEKRLLRNVKETRAAYTDSYQQFLHLLLIDKNREAAAELMVAQTLPALFRYHSAWDEFAWFQFDEVKQVSDQGQQHHATTRRIMLGLDFMVALLTVGIALIATRRVARVVNSRIRMQQEVYRLNAELEQRVTQRTLALQRTENRLRGSLGELQEYTSRVETVNQLVELLQSCLTPEEGYQQAARVLEHFFPEGTLLMLNPSRNLLDLACSWGESSPRRGPFSRESCWALRKGRTHVVQPGNFSLLCGHVDPTSTACHVCVPMIAQGESLGVLSVSDSRLHDPATEARGVKRMQELANTLAEQISLAFANLMLRETLKYQSVRDPLTNLFNRRHMEEGLQRELSRAERNGNPVTVLMADVDRFKLFNDAFGHEAGDLLLRDLGALLAAEIRGGDIACRYGGEEFLLILADTDLQAACERAAKIQEQVRNLHVRYRGETLRRITLSIGVAGFPQHGRTASQIVTAADRALYQAKASGRDQVVVAGEETGVAEIAAPVSATEVLANSRS
jgi:diguanylate cyclase (GGDEF)-like protein